MDTTRKPPPDFKVLEPSFWTNIETEPLLRISLNNIIEQLLQEELDSSSTQLKDGGDQGHPRKAYQEILTHLTSTPNFQNLRTNIHQSRSNISFKLMEALHHANTDTPSDDDARHDTITHANKDESLNRKKCKINESVQDSTTMKSFSLFALLDSFSMTQQTKRISAKDILDLYQLHSPPNWDSVFETCQQVEDMEHLLLGASFYNDSDRDQDLQDLWTLLLEGLLTSSEESVLYKITDIHRVWFNHCKSSSNKNRHLNGEIDFIQCQIFLLLNICLALHLHAKRKTSSRRIVSKLAHVFHEMIVSSGFTTNMSSTIHFVCSSLENQWKDTVNVILYLILCCDKDDNVSKDNHYPCLLILSEIDPTAQWFSMLIHSLPCPLSLVDVLQGTGLIQALLAMTVLTHGNDANRSEILLPTSDTFCFSTRDKPSAIIFIQALYMLRSILFNLGAYVSTINWTLPPQCNIHDKASSSSESPKEFVDLILSQIKNNQQTCIQTQTSSASKINKALQPFQVISRFSEMEESQLISQYPSFVSMCRETINCLLPTNQHDLQGNIGE